MHSLNHTVTHMALERMLWHVQALVASNGIYRIRAAKGSERDTHTNYVYSFVKAVSNELNFTTSCSINVVVLNFLHCSTYYLKYHLIDI